MIPFVFHQSARWASARKSPGEPVHACDAFRDGHLGLMSREPHRLEPNWFYDRASCLRVGVGPRPRREDGFAPGLPGGRPPRSRKKKLKRQFYKKKSISGRPCHLFRSLRWAYSCCRYYIIKYLGIWIRDLELRFGAYRSNTNIYVLLFKIIWNMFLNIIY